MLCGLLLRGAARRGASSLSRLQCSTTMKANGIAANRYLTLSSWSPSGVSTGNGTSGIIPTEDPRTSSEKLSSSNNKDKDPSRTPPPTASEYVYVHPLSQIVLQHLQSEECREWITQEGLDRDLTVHRDGTFSLQTLPPAATDSNIANTDTSAGASAGASVRIWTAYSPDEKKHWLTYSRITEGGDHSTSSPADDDNRPAALTAAEATSETTATRVRHRFLLQDNEKTAWNDDKNSLPNRIQEFVSELMLTVRADSAKNNQRNL